MDPSEAKGGSPGGIRRVALRFPRRQRVGVDRDALLEHYTKGREELLLAIDGLSDEMMSEPSIDGWSVKDHLAHLAFWDDTRASEVVRISAGHESAWRMTDEQDDAYSELGYRA